MKRSPSLFAIAGVLVSVLLLCGCTVGPDYETPETRAPEEFAADAADDATIDAVAEPSVYEAGQPEIEWWRLLDDPLLHELVERALAENHDLRIARANVRRARALLGVERLERWPVATAGASAERERQSAAVVPQEFDNTRTFYSVRLDAAWELDLFGRVRRSVEARAADAEARVADERGAAVSVAAEVARTYLELRGAQYRLRVAERNARNQEETHELTRALLEGGRGTDLDLARAEAQLQQTLASLPPLERAIASAIHRLGVLVGEGPTALRPELAEVDDLPELPTRLAVGDPAGLLRRRPDVQSAERELAAVTARVGVAVADLYPRVTLNGSVGFLATEVDGLFDSGRRTSSIGPFLSWAAFDLGRVKRRIDATEAEADAVLARWEKTVLEALEETENALVGYVRSRQRQARLAVAAEASARAAELARVRYRYGAESFLAVLDAERRLLEAQDLEARAATESAVAFTRLYKALGGGWQAVTDDLISTDPEVEEMEPQEEPVAKPYSPSR